MQPGCLAFPANPLLPNSDEHIDSEEEDNDDFNRNFQVTTLKQGSASPILSIQVARIVAVELRHPF